VQSIFQHLVSGDEEGHHILIKGTIHQEVRKGEVAQTMYTHVSKCKNHKIKGENYSSIKLFRNHPI
jgi:hypothetical protein